MKAINILIQAYNIQNPFLIHMLIQQLTLINNYVGSLSFKKKNKLSYTLKLERLTTLRENGKKKKKPSIERTLPPKLYLYNMFNQHFLFI